jgi:ribonuclease P protein component
MHFSTFFSKVQRISPKRIIFVVVIAFSGLLLFMNDGQRFTFTKEERVTGEKRIDALFSRGASFVAYPFRVVFLESERTFPVLPLSVLISIPKKRIRSAAKRNRIKRLIREAYRLNKHLFDPKLLPPGSRLDLAFVYVRDQGADYELIEKGVRKALISLEIHLNTKEGPC